MNIARPNLAEGGGITVRLIPTPEEPDPVEPVDDNGSPTIPSE